MTFWFTQPTDHVGQGTIQKSGLAKNVDWSLVIKRATAPQDSTASFKLSHKGSLFLLPKPVLPSPS